LAFKAISIKDSTSLESPRPSIHDSIGIQTDTFTQTYFAHQDIMMQNFKNYLNCYVEKCNHIS